MDENGDNPRASAAIASALENNSRGATGDPFFAREGVTLARGHGRPDELNPKRGGEGESPGKRDSRSRERAHSARVNTNPLPPPSREGECVR
jgi:hypothetical protein